MVKDKKKVKEILDRKTKIKTKRVNIRKKKKSKIDNYWD